MIKLILACLILLPIQLIAQGLAEGEKDFDFPEFRECGLVTRYAPTKINAGCLTEALNVRYDENFSVSRRDGRAQYNITPCTNAKAIKGLWNFAAPDGQDYLVIHSSQTLFQTKGEGDCTAIPGANNLNATAYLECVQDQGKLWCTNGIDTPFYWTGTATAAVSAMPLGTKIGAFRSRIVIADIPDEKSRFKMSEEGDGTAWTIYVPGVSTSATSIQISGLNDGKAIKCLMGQYQDAYYIGREDDLYALIGTDRRNFKLTKISDEVGCKDQRSVKEKDNCLTWLSNRGQEKMCGTTITRVSDVIRPTIEEIIDSFGNSRSKTYNSQSEWEAGSYSAQRSQLGPTSTTIYPGSVVPSTWGYTDTTGLDFASGTLTNISTTFLDGYAVLASSADDNFDLELSTEACLSTSGNSHFSAPNCTLFGAAGTYTLQLPQWLMSFTVSNPACGGTTASPCLEAIHVSSLALYASSSYMSAGMIYCDNVTETPKGSVIFYNALTGAVIQTDSISSESAAISTHTVDMTSWPEAIYVEYRNGYASSSFFRSDVFYTWEFSGYTFTYYTYGTRTSAGCGTGNDSHRMFIDLPTGQEIAFAASGSIVSQVYDTTFSTPVGGPFSFSETVPVGSTIAYSIRESSTSALPAWSSWATVSTTTSGAYRIPLTKRYWEYQSAISTNYSTQTPRIASISLAATATGYFITDCIDATGISSWGNYRPTSIFPYSDSVSYFVSSGTSCNQVTRSTANWVAQTANSFINIDTATYLGSMFFLKPVTSSDTIRVDALTAEWNEGSSRPPVASVVWHDRYYMFFTTSTASGAANDHALVLDSQDKWSLYDNTPGAAAEVFNGDIFIGDSANTGYLYQFETGIDDNGSDFLYRFQTAAISLTSPVEKKLFRRLYLFLKSEERSGQNIDLTVKYYIDGSTTAYSMGAADLSEGTETGYFVAKYPASLEQPNTFHWISFSVEANGKQGPIDVYGIKIVYRPIEWD